MQAVDASDVPPPRPHRLFWWKEIAIMVAFYLVYSWTRNQFGSNRIAADGVPEQAFNNAERVIRWERAIGLYHEETIQDWFLPYDWFIKFWNTWYGTMHFFVTLAVFWVLFFRRRHVFAQWRNTLAAMTALAILGFAFFPLMPPRLLDDPCPAQAPAGQVDFGGRCIPSGLRDGPNGPYAPDASFGFTDTLADVGGPWSFESDTMASISNQYAAMPSLHIGWSTWCAIAMWPLLRRRWTKLAWLLYPAATLFCIVVTANHYWLDGVGGLVVFGIGSLIGWGLHRWNQDRLDARWVAEHVPSRRIEPPVAFTDARADGEHPVAAETAAEAAEDAEAVAEAEAGADGEVVAAPELDVGRPPSPGRPPPD